jgi:hypothetical protein
VSSKPGALQTNQKSWLSLSFPILAPGCERRRSCASRREAKSQRSFVADAVAGLGALGFGIGLTDW